MESTFVRPLAVQALVELGIDISRRESKTLEPPQRTILILESSRRFGPSGLPIGSNRLMVGKVHKVGWVIHRMSIVSSGMTQRVNALFTAF
jgi:hypothetical protein